MLSDAFVAYGDNLYADMTGVTWYNNQAQFVMPASDVVVYANFEEVNERSRAIAMPNSGTVRAVIPEYVPYFSIYTDGYYSYPNNSDGTLVLTAPEGYTFEVLGAACTADDGDSLVIYDGADASVEKLLKITGEMESCNLFYGSANIYTYSSGRNMTLHFKSNEAGYHYGLGLNVMPMKKTGSSAVAIYENAINYKLARIDGSYAGTDAVNISESVMVDAVEYNREFPTGVYSTMMLPFDVNTGNVSGLEAALYYNGIGTDKNGHQAIKMKVLWATNDWAIANNITKTYLDTNLKANTPYLVQMSAKTFVVNGGVTIVPTAETAEPKNDWVFRGTWQYKKWGAFCSTEGQNCDPETGYAYGFAASSSDDNNISVGDFVKVGEGAWIRPMRAYLVHKDKLQTTQFVRANGSYVKRSSAVPEELPEFMSVIIDVDGDGDGKETTVIGQFNTRTGEFKMNYDRGTFDLKGRRVNSANKARGAYYGKNVLKK